MCACSELRKQWMFYHVSLLPSSASNSPNVVTQCFTKSHKIGHRYKLGNQTPKPTTDDNNNTRDIEVHLSDKTSPQGKLSSNGVSLM